MSRINTNIPALLATRILNDNTTALNKSLERLSTGLRINRGADDPAGLIASENLRKQIRGTDTAVKNAERAINIISTAEGSLIEVSAMLLDLQGLLGEVANKGGISSEEVDANQLQVDSILNSINRVANTTEFNGLKLLNGSLGYTLSGLSSTEIAEVNVNAAKLIDGAAMTVATTVTTSAQTGTLYLSGNGLSSSGTLTIQLGTGRGTTELTFAASATNSAIASGINAVKEITGISASTSAAIVTLNSVDFGSDAYVSVEILAGDADHVAAFDLTASVAGTASTDLTDKGVDVVAIVNGSSATGDGKILTIRTAMLDAEIDLTVAQATSTTSSSFTITGGGSDFALGASVDALSLESFGIQSVVTSKLGNTTDGFLNTLASGKLNSLKSTNLITAQKILSSAIKDVTTLRGRLGSFQKNTLETTINALKITGENLMAAESALRDTDFARETSNLTRAQILVSAATNVLAQANFAPQSVLALLG